MERKPSKRPDSGEIVYSTKRWNLLRELRQKAIHIMNSLEQSTLKPIVHGSIARGDVTHRSDIDIFIPAYVSSFAVLNALERADITPRRLYVIQATPHYAMKAYVEIDETTTVSFPLMKLRKVEREFYRFGGQIDTEDLKKDLRVAGVDKRLMLIEPTNEGHAETTIVNREEYVAKILHVSVETVSDRANALLRRDQIGRTGVFIKEELSEGETFELHLEKIAAKKPAVRRRLKNYS
jgi:predicted nucleotidyltransferase